MLAGAASAEGMKGPPMTHGSITASLIAAILLSGCSLNFVRGPHPTGHPQREASGEWCTASYGWPVADIPLGLGGGQALLLAARLEESELAAPLLLAGVGVPIFFLASSAEGFRRVADCRALRRELRPKGDSGSVLPSRHFMRRGADAKRTAPGTSG